MIELKQAYRNSANRSQRFDLPFFHRKVFAPAITARMKKPHQLASRGINRTDVASFALVAKNTAICEVIRSGYSAVLFRDDMIDPMACQRHRFGHQAILAPV